MSTAFLITSTKQKLYLKIEAVTKFAGLHIHTFYSDGTSSPQEVVDQAKESGLGAVAITDHDTFDMEMVRTHARYVLDTRRRVPAAEHVEYL